MRHRNHGRKFRQGRGQNRSRTRQLRRPARRPASGMGALRRIRSNVEHKPDLCFGQLLPCQLVEEALCRSGLVFRQCLYTPLVTLWTFLYQVLCPDPSCQAAVSRLLAILGAQGDDSVSPDTGPYCKARERLPEELVADLARQMQGGCKPAGPPRNSCRVGPSRSPTAPR